MRKMHDTTKEDLEQINHNVYEAIQVMGQRSRQIGDHQKSILNKLHDEYQSTLNLSEDLPDEPEELEIPAFTKPSVQALNELLDGEITYEYLDPAEGEEEA